MLGQEQVCEARSRACEATDTTRGTLGASTCSAAGRGLADRTRPARLEGHGSEVRRARGSPQVTHPSPSHPGGGRTYLHSGADDVHGVGEDGGSGRSQGPRDSLEDDVRALLRTEV